MLKFPPGENEPARKIQKGEFFRGLSQRWVRKFSSEKERKRKELIERPRTCKRHLLEKRGLGDRGRIRGRTILPNSIRSHPKTKGPPQHNSIQRKKTWPWLTKKSV